MSLALCQCPPPGRPCDCISTWHTPIVICGVPFCVHSPADRSSRQGCQSGTGQRIAQKERYCQPGLGDRQIAHTPQTPHAWKNTIYFGLRWLLSPSGDLGIGLVWDNRTTGPHRTATFRSDCWNPLQTELNYLWGVLSCSQDDIRWFSD